MQVNPSHSSDPVGQTELVRRAAAKPQSASDGVSFGGFRALNQSLVETPDIRPEMVDRARQLINDTSYPPPVAISKISSLLATKISQENQSGEEA